MGAARPTSCQDPEKETVSYLGRLFQGWGRVGIVLINMKGVPSRTNHHDESRLFPIMGTSQKVNLDFVSRKPVTQVGTLSFPGEGPLEVVGGKLHSWDRSFLGKSKSQHVSKWPFIYSLKKCLLSLLKSNRSTKSMRYRMTYKAFDGVTPDFFLHPIS